LRLTNDYTYDYYSCEIVAVSQLLSYVDEVLLYQSTSSDNALSSLMTWHAVCRAHSLSHVSGTHLRRRRDSLKLNSVAQPG